MLVPKIIILTICATRIIGNRIHFENLYHPQQFAEYLQKAVKENNISRTCSNSVQLYATDLLSRKFWAMKLFDAGGRFPQGLFSGNSGDLGFFDQCLEVNKVINNDTIIGKYCIGEININNYNWNLTDMIIEQSNTIKKSTPLFIATCFPHTCSATEISELHSSLFGTPFSHSEERCQTKHSKQDFDYLAIGAICLLIFMASAMILSTTYDVYNYYSKKRPSSELLTAFSILENSKRLWKKNTDKNQISCLYGIGVLSMLVVILVHRFKIYLTEMLLRNKSSIGEDMPPNLKNTAVIVDTFFLLSGLTISYRFMERKGKNQQFNLWRFFIHRYLRLTPSYAAIIFINVSLLKHLGSGPQWPTLVQKTLEKPCRKYWWSALLYIQNYYNPYEQCMGQTWYLSIDMQLYFLSPLLLIPFLKWPKAKIPTLSILIIAAPILTFFIFWLMELSDRFDLGLESGRKYLKYGYFPTHTRVAPWLVGLAAGYILKASKHKEIKKHIAKPIFCTLNIIFWTASLVIMTTCVFGGNDIGDESQILAASIFFSFVPFAWAIALSYIIFACFTNIGGPINWFLSNRMMEVLSKFTYCLYLLHKTVMSLDIYMTRTTIDYSLSYTVFAMGADVFYSLLLSVIWMFAFELPFATIDRVLVGH